VGVCFHETSIPLGGSFTIKYVVVSALLNPAIYVFICCSRSFDGAKEHGVLLPSTEELTAEESQEEPYRAWRIRGGANNQRRESIGTHKTAPTHSIEMAGEYQRAREFSAELEQFYDVPGGGNFM
jgi:hypothetical protein